MPAGQDRERADEELLHDAAARLRRATLILVLLLGPLIFLPLRTPPELLAPRAINLGLHLAVTLLAFALVRRLVARALVAPATALLFAVHPIHVEAIAIPSARTELLSTALSLTALLCFTHAGTSRVAGRIAAPGTGGRHAAAWLAGVCLFLGLTVSPTTLAVPPLLLGLNYLLWPRAGSSAPGWWTAKLSAYIPAAVALLTFLALRSMGLFSTPYSPLGAGAGSGVASALSLFVRQVGSLFYPVNLLTLPAWTPPEPRTDLLQPLPMLGLAALTGLLWLAARPYWRQGRGAAQSLASFAALLFLIPYVVVAARSSLDGTDFSERSLYFPSVGFCLLLALAIGAVSTGWSPGAQHRLPGPASVRKVGLAAFTLAALILGFSILTWARCLEWRGERPNHETTSGTIRVGENGSSSSGVFPSTMHRAR